MITSLKVGAIFEIRDQALPVVQRLAVAMQELAKFTATVRTEMQSLSSVRIGSITTRIDALVASMDKGATAAAAMASAASAGTAQMDAGLTAALASARALTAQLTAAGRAGAGLGRGGGFGGFGGGGPPPLPGAGGGGRHIGPHFGRVGAHVGPMHVSSGTSGGGIATGVGLWSVGHVMHEAMDPLHQEAQLRTLGLNDEQIAQVTARARATATAVPGSGYAANIKTIGELYSVVGLPHALGLSEKFATIDRVMALSGKGKEEGSGYILARAGELLGKLSDPNDLSEFEKTLDQMTRVGIATHGKVTPAEWLNYAKQAGPAAGSLTDAGFYTTASIIQAMGGHRAGTAAAALQRQFAGGKMTKPVALELERLGIALPGDFEFDHGHVIPKTDAMKSLVERLQADPLSAVVDVIEPAMRRKGIASLAHQTQEIYKIIGTGPAQREVYELLRGSRQMRGEAARMRQAQGPEAALGTGLSHDPVAAMGAFTKAFNDMLGAIGGPTMQASIPAMNRLTSFFNSVSTTASEHKQATGWVGSILAGMAGGAGLGFLTGWLGGPVGAGGGALIGGGIGAGYATWNALPDSVRSGASTGFDLGLRTGIPGAPQLAGAVGGIWGAVPSLLPSGTAAAAQPSIKIEVGGLTVKAETDDPRGLAEKILGEINKLISAGHLHNQGTADSTDSSPFATGVALP